MVTSLASRIAAKYLEEPLSIKEKELEQEDKPEHALNLDLSIMAELEGIADPKSVLKLLTKSLSASIRVAFEELESELGMDIISLNVKPIQVEYDLSDTDSSKGSVSLEQEIPISPKPTHQDLDDIIGFKHKNTDDIRALLDSRDSLSNDEDYSMIPADRDTDPNFADDEQEHDLTEYDPDQEEDTDDVDYEDEEDIDEDEEDEEEDEDEDEDKEFDEDYEEDDEDEDEDEDDEDEDE